MYSREYEDKSEIKLPDGYDGTAFCEREERCDTIFQKPEIKEAEIKFSGFAAEPESEDVFLKNEHKERFKMPKLDFSSFSSTFFGKAFSFKSLIPEKIDIEDVLIIGIAVFLLFSKSRDIECSVMLLLLFFIRT